MAQVYPAGDGSAVFVTQGPGLQLVQSFQGQGAPYNSGAFHTLGAQPQSQPQQAAQALGRNVTQFIHVPVSSASGVGPHQTLTFVDASSGAHLVTASQPGDPRFVQHGAFVPSQQHFVQAQQLRPAPRQGTVTQVPAFVQAGQAVPQQQQQVLHMVDVGGAQRIVNPVLGPAGKNVVQQRTAVPVTLSTTSMPSLVHLGPRNPASTTLMRHSMPAPQLRAVNGPSPPSVVYASPTMGVQQQPLTMVGRPALVTAPHVRVPKMTTVATYNPATGVRSLAVGGQQQQTITLAPPPMDRGVGLQQAVGMQGRMPQQVQKVTLIQHGGAPHASQMMGGVQAGVAQRGLAPSAHQGQLVNITLADGTVATAVMDQATLARLVGMQGGGGVAQAPASAAQAISGVPINLHASSTAQSQQIALPLASSAAPGDSDDQLLQAALQLQAQEQEAFLAASAEAGQADAAPRAAGAASAAGKEDLKAILVSIGQELARNGFSVEEAMAAGWLGTLSMGDVAVLADAFANEERAATVAAMSGATAAAAFDGGVAPQARPDSPASSAAASAADADAASGSASGQAVPSAAALHGGGPVAAAPPRFDAFAYGFFGKPRDASLQSLEDSDALDKLLGSPAWGSMADELDLSATEVAGKAAVASTRDSASELQGGARGARGGAKAALDLSPLKPAPQAPAATDFAARFAQLDLGCGFF